MAVKGKIVQVTTGVSCGIFCGCGTIKIQPEKKIAGYRHPYVFVAVPCLTGPEADYLHKLVVIKVDILKLRNKDCFWSELPMNNIDSKGVPFYIPSNLNEPLQVR
jgi:hypothetical protein